LAKEKSGVVGSARLHSLSDDTLVSPEEESDEA
jgi:hypothetical protein